MQKLAPFFAPILTLVPVMPTTTMGSAVTFDASYEHVKAVVPVSKFTAKGLPVYHPVYGYGFVPHSALKTFFNPATYMATFASSSTTVKKFGGSVVVGKCALIVNTTHQTYQAFIPAIIKAVKNVPGLALNFPK